VGNVEVELDLDLQPGWNPLRLTIDRIRSDGRVEAGYRSTLGSDLVWFFWPLN
jgi:hypothetical protein